MNAGWYHYVFYILKTYFTFKYVYRDLKWLTIVFAFLSVSIFYFDANYIWFWIEVIVNSIFITDIALRIFISNSIMVRALVTSFSYSLCRYYLFSWHLNILLLIALSGDIINPGIHRIG